jgi:hypothetical protein
VVRCGASRARTIAARRTTPPIVVRSGRSAAAASRVRIWRAKRCLILNRVQRLDDDGEPVWDDLQQRLARRGVGAAEAAHEWSAHYVVFGLLREGGDLVGWPYQRRRTASATRRARSYWVAVRLRVSGRSTAWSSVSFRVQGAQVGGHHPAASDGAGVVVDDRLHNPFVQAGLVRPAAQGALRVLY